MKKLEFGVVGKNANSINSASLSAYARYIWWSISNKLATAFWNGYSGKGAVIKGLFDNLCQSLANILIMY